VKGAKRRGERGEGEGKEMQDARYRIYGEVNKREERGFRGEREKIKGGRQLRIRDWGTQEKEARIHDARYRNTGLTCIFLYLQLFSRGNMGLCPMTPQAR